MSLNSIFINVYYPLKPYMPRRVQLTLRRAFALAKRRVHRHCWPVKPGSAMLPDRWGGWPEGKRFALVLTHDVDTQRGHDKCLNLMNMEQEEGFVSSFNFVASEYAVSAGLRNTLVDNGFEVGLHGLYHNAELYESHDKFNRQAVRINEYLHEWQAVGFRSPCMYHNLEWMHALNISYDASTFDTDPFEPQPDGVGTIFPFTVEAPDGHRYVELPYTLPQDFTLFVLFKEKNIATWKQKLDWVVRHGGMVLLNTHPDYMNFGNEQRSYESYPAQYYRELLRFIEKKYDGCYWHVLHRQMAQFWREREEEKPGKPESLIVEADAMGGARAYA